MKKVIQHNGLKAPLILVDELADTFQEGSGRSGVFTPKLGKLLNELNQGIANYAVLRFKEILYDKKLPENTPAGWYEWDVKFIEEEQVTKVAPTVYPKYEGTEALNIMNKIARKEGGYGNLASAGATHFIPSFATFGFSINKAKDNNNFSNSFGALGRKHIPLLMLYPEMHKDKVINVSEKGWKEIKRANKAIDTYYKTKMKY